MMTSRLSGHLATAAGAFVALVGCFGLESSADTPREPWPKVGLRFELPAHVAYGEVTAVAVVLENTGVANLEIDALVVSAGGVRLAAAPPPFSFHAAAGPEGRLVVAGTCSVDDPGPAARAPSPPRWEFAGAVTLTSAAALSPRASITLRATVRATDETRGLEADVSYRVLPPGMPAYRVSSLDVAPVASPRGPPAGPSWHVAAEATGTLAPAREIAADGAVAIGAARGPAGPVPLPGLFSHAFPAGSLARIAPLSASATAALPIERPRFGIEAARARARVAAGRAVYFAPLEAWFLVDRGRTAVASPLGVHVVSGDACPLALALYDRERIAVSIGDEASSGELARRFAAKGFAIERSLEKGGSFRTEVRVPRAELERFIEAVDSFGLEVRGLSLRAAR